MYSHGVQGELLDKLEQSKNSTIQAILKELRKFNALREEEVEFAIISARKSLDYIIRSSSTLADIKAGTKPLDGLIDELLKVKFLPSVIHKHCKIIKEFGNIAAHGITADFSDVESSELTDIEVSICSYSLNAVVSWYATKVLQKVLDIFPFKIIAGKEITEEQIVEAIEIDNNVYSEGFRGIYQVCMEWYHKNPDIYRFIIDQNINKVVGYINAMPIEDETLRPLNQVV
ncbi:DUF4145 domain-containing protein [Paenibacillus sp. N3.4]|uniref:DUF4145 domain-containing protein n=1 Tax=Paenibacillus sp. N3.4 TaxID=2603222 RepID=UPI001C9C5350|nr:DUF4145 domain-containing protein [Paenibacillus sp. N3.4]